MEIGLSLGSNLGDRLEHLRRAARRIAALPGVRVTAVAPVYETEPVGARPDYARLKYLNTVLILEASGNLDTLSDALHGIEDDLGRRREADRNAPRTIDIDVLYAGDTRREDGKLDLPHPRWAERRFVVQPLADVRPDLVLPGTERTVAGQLALLRDDKNVVCFGSKNMNTIDTMILLPQPRKVAARQGCLAVTAIREIVIQGNPADLLGIAERLQAEVTDHARVSLPIRAGVAKDTAAVLDLAPRAGLPRQGYRLTVGPKGLLLRASDPAGLFYGVMTLTQILRQSPCALPACAIDDHPDFPSRGVMLDVSRDKVPTLETLFALVDQLAELKLNHLELYTEHTFAYRRHAAVWAQASPVTGEDVLRLDAYCRERFVELVPNQNSFGHMERWLALPAYAGLAESPDGFEYPWGGRSDHASCLNPRDPRSLALMEDLYNDLLPHFTSRKFNVGCDETWELGQGKSKDLCARRGHGRVYLDFLLKLHRLVRRHGRTMHFWGDIIMKHPELVAELPRDIVVLEWGYEANHPFAEHGAKFAQTGIPFYVCPGTSSWNAIAGRTENCLGNLRNAAANGLKHGATGFLNTDWGDNGHWQYLPVSYLGFAAGGALSWCERANREADIRPGLDWHVFGDAAGVMGGVAHDLGNAYLKTGHLLGNSTVPFQLLFNGPNWQIPAKVTRRTLTATRDYIEEAAGRLSSARMNRPDAALVADEFANAARMMAHACDRGMWRLGGARKTGEATRNLARDLRTILGEHRRLWTARNRPGGLQDSARRLEARLGDYAG